MEKSWEEYCWDVLARILKAVLYVDSCLVLKASTNLGKKTLKNLDKNLTKNQETVLKVSCMILQGVFVRVLPWFQRNIKFLSHRKKLKRCERLTNRHTVWWTRGFQARLGSWRWICGWVGPPSRHRRPSAPRSVPSECGQSSFTLSVTKYQFVDCFERTKNCEQVWWVPTELLPLSF